MNSSQHVIGPQGHTNINISYDFSLNFEKDLKFTAMQIEKISFVNKNEKRDNMTRHFWIQYKRQSNPNKIYVST